MTQVIQGVDAWHLKSAYMVHWSGAIPYDRQSHQRMQSMQFVRKLNGMCVGVVLCAHNPQCETAAVHEGWKCLLLVGPTRGTRGSRPYVLQMRFARAPELADARGSVHPIVQLWRWGLRAAERDVLHKNSGVFSTQITILGAFESPNT